MNESVDVSTPVRAIIADDHPLVLLAVENLMTGFPNMQIVGRASDSAELFAEADRVECDLAVIDLYMPGSIDADAFGTLRQFRKRHPKVALVVLTMETSPEVLERLISLGVDAAMSKRDRIDLIHVAIVNALAHERYVGPAVRAALADATVARRLAFPASAAVGRLIPQSPRVAHEQTDVGGPISTGSQFAGCWSGLSTLRPEPYEVSGGSCVVNS